LMMSYTWQWLTVDDELHSATVNDDLHLMMSYTWQWLTVDDELHSATVNDDLHLMMSYTWQWLTVDDDVHLSSQRVHTPIYSHPCSSPLETYVISIHELISRIS